MHDKAYCFIKYVVKLGVCLLFDQALDSNLALDSNFSNFNVYHCLENIILIIKKASFSSYV